MPIYEYACVSCDHHLEALQKMSEDPLVFCPECGEESLRKKVSAAAFVLKGSGWYETDFKNSGKEKPKDAKTSGEQSASKNHSDTKSGEGASGDTKSSDSKSSESKSSESKSSESKSSESKSESSKSTSDSTATGSKSGGTKTASPTN
ncbi:MAG: zinc ribbon domain-containing protein [Arenicellales bacterium]|nr:zinc ribbon domain-containing protein [Arenicellales bacterium]